MERLRVMAVRADGFGPGSGYVVGGRLALTSAHVVGPVGSRVRVFRPGEPAVFDAVVAWRGTPGGRDDGALLVLDDARWAPPGGGGVRWGRTVMFQPGVECQTWGVPDAVQAAGAAVEVAQPSGKLSPGEGLVADRYVIDLDGAAPTGWGEVTSPWGGLSGAALFCGKLLAGVVVGAADGWGNRRLTAVPAYALRASPGFTAVLAEHGVVSVLEPVEFQDIVEPAVVTDPGGLIASPAGLLVARRAVVPFYGREQVLEQLEGWARGSDAVAVWLVHGPGGQGKTRLARQLSTRLAADGWVSAWLRPDATPDDLTLLAGTARETLVVVDYAESRTGQLATLLTALGARRDGAAVRVLLLARADDWWRDMPADVPGAEDLIETAVVTELGVLDESEQARRAGYRAAVAAFAAALPTVAAQQDADWPRAAAALFAPRFPDRIGALTVHMTALADLLDAVYPEPADPHAPAVAGVHEVEDRLLNHEFRYWYSTAAAQALSPALSRTTLREAMAAVHLCGASTRDQADALLVRTPGLADQLNDRRSAVREWITALYPPTAPGAPWDGLQPDRLAERFVGRYLAKEPALPDALVPHVNAAQAEHLLTVYARAAAHPVFDQALDPQLTALMLRHPDVLAPAAIRSATRVERPAPILGALRQIGDDPATSLDQLDQLADHIPPASYTLADWAARLYARLVDEHRSLARREGVAALPALGDSLQNLAGWLRDRDRWEEALTASTEAVDIFRRLSAAEPDVFLPDLTHSLSTHGVDLRECDRWEEGVDAIEEAVEISRQLAAARPDEFLPQLAGGLLNLANVLGDIHRHGRDEALDAISEAVDIYRRLSAAEPDVFLPSLADSLNNLASSLGAFSRWEQAVAATSEAVDIYRRLAEESPDEFLPDLAGGLRNLALDLGGLDDLDEEQVVAVSTEAIVAYRRLAAAVPDHFLPDLAGTLNEFARDLTDLGLSEQALAVNIEAIATYRRLAEESPDEFLPDLADSLTNLAVALGERGRWEEALATLAEAIATRRSLAAAGSRRPAPGLADSLKTLSTRLSAIKDQERSVAALTSLVGIYRQLATESPDEFLAGLPGMLDDLHLELAGGLGRWEQALAVSTEAVEVSRQLAAARPEEFLPDLAERLMQRANDLGRLARSEQAVAEGTEAVKIYRQLFAAQPRQFRRSLADSLQTLACFLKDLGQFDQAAETMTESITIYRPLASADPVRHQPSLVLKLEDLVTLLEEFGDLGQRGQAVDAIAEALAIHRELGERPSRLLGPERERLLQLLARLNVHPAGEEDTY